MRAVQKTADQGGLFFTKNQWTSLLHWSTDFVVIYMAACAVLTVWLAYVAHVGS